MTITVRRRRGRSRPPSSTAQPLDQALAAAVASSCADGSAPADHQERCAAVVSAAVAQRDAWARLSTRQRVLQAAQALFPQFGYAGTTVEVICHQAAVSKGTVFTHFASKEALGAAALEAWSVSTCAALSAAAMDGGDHPHRQLDRFRQALMQPDFHQQCFLVAMLVPDAIHPLPAIRAAGVAHATRWSQIIAGLLTRVQAAGHRSRVPIDVDQVAWLAQCLWSGVVQSAYLRSDQCVLAAGVELLCSHITGLWYPDGEEAPPGTCRMPSMEIGGAVVRRPAAAADSRFDP